MTTKKMIDYGKKKNDTGNNGSGRKVKRDELAQEKHLGWVDRKPYGKGVKG